MHMPLQKATPKALAGCSVKNMHAFSKVMAAKYAWRMLTFVARVGTSLQALGLATLKSATFSIEHLLKWASC